MDSGTSQAAIESVQHVGHGALSADAPIHERINDAYDRSREHAINSAMAAIEAGCLLNEQQARLKLEKGRGYWLVWLARNCPAISRSTVNNLMRTADYFRETRHVSATSVRQLYLEVGIIKQDDGDGSGRPCPGSGFFQPIESVFDACHLFYTDELLNTIPPARAPKILGLVRKAKDEMVSLEARLLERFGDHEVDAL